MWGKFFPCVSNQTTTREQFLLGYLRTLRVQTVEVKPHPVGPVLLMLLSSRVGEGDGVGWGTSTGWHFRHPRDSSCDELTLCLGDSRIVSKAGTGRNSGATQNLLYPLIVVVRVRQTTRHSLFQETETTSTEVRRHYPIVQSNVHPILGSGKCLGLKYPWLYSHFWDIKGFQKLFLHDS